jgi:hypothetical protein
MMNENDRTEESEDTAKPEDPWWYLKAPSGNVSGRRTGEQREPAPRY